MLYCIVYCWTEEEGSNAVAAGVRAGGLQHAGGAAAQPQFRAGDPSGRLGAAHAAQQQSPGFWRGRKLRWWPGSLKAWWGRGALKK